VSLGIAIAAENCTTNVSHHAEEAGVAEEAVLTSV
jgi:hypothetical protein